MGEAGEGRKGWFELGRCASLIKVDIYMCVCVCINFTHSLYYVPLGFTCRLHKKRRDH